MYYARGDNTRARAVASVTVRIILLTAPPSPCLDVAATVSPDPPFFFFIPQNLIT